MPEPGLNCVDMSRLLSRFMTNVSTSVTGSCWLWRGAVNQSGYGLFYACSKALKAHRFAYSVMVGDPTCLEIDHMCRVRNCVNPDHLRAVTHAVSAAARSAMRELTHCKNGHEFSEENTYRVAGKRQCRECQRERVRQWRGRNPNWWKGRVA